MSQSRSEFAPTPEPEEVTIVEGRDRFGTLAGRAAHTGQRTIIVDHGEPIAAIVSVRELEDLEDALEIARFEAEKASGSLRTIPHEEVERHLGLSP